MGQQLIYCTDCRGNRIYALDKSTYFDKYDLLKFIPKLTSRKELFELEKTIYALF